MRTYFRWSFRYDQWWECKFLSEGVIDQGGGFRDSLSDLSEELCPSASDVPVPLPFFIRSPNQVGGSLCLLLHCSVFRTDVQYFYSIFKSSILHWLLENLAEKGHYSPAEPHKNKNTCRF